MATTVELLAKFRRDNDDNVAPYLWSDTEFEDYLDEAQDEFCELVDAIAADITITYSASDTTVALPEYVTRIRSADIVGSRNYLTLANQEEFENSPAMFVDDDYGQDRQSASWKDTTATEPRVLITDMESDKLRLYPIPTANGTIGLRVYRKSTTVPDTTTPVELEVTGSQHQRTILLKVRSLAYEKQDSETYDIQQARDLEAKFLNRCDEIRQRERRRHRRSNTTNYGGIY